MSVQLILYPQSYDGYYNSTSYPTSNNFLVQNGVGGFTNLNASTLSGYSGNSGNVQQLMIQGNPPTILNQWYRYTTTGGATYANVAGPQNIAGSKCYFSGVGITQENRSGVYLRVNGITPGTQVTIFGDFGTADDGDFYLNVRDTTSNYGLYTQLLTSPVLGNTFQKTFVCNLPEIVIALEWRGYTSFVGNACVVETIKMFPTANPTSLAFTDLSDGQVICDLYEDEDIPLTLSIDDFKNVAEKVQSYSKAFNLPATKRNNQIFDNMFDVTRTANGTLAFNPYIKTQALLKQDGFTLFDGYLRLVDVTDKEGEISYNVNLYSEAVALADVLKDRKFLDLDLSELAHDYEKQNIKRSWTDSGAGITWLNPNTSGFRNDHTTLRYPFIDWSHQIAVGGTNAGGATTGNPELLTLEDAFRPCINIKYLIDRIFNQDIMGSSFPFTYESSFFNTSDFKKLYMDFNWGTTVFGETTTGSEYACGYEANVFTPTAGFNYATATYDVMELSQLFIVVSQTVGTGYPPGYDGATSVITSTNLNEYWEIEYTYVVENSDTVARTVECRWLETNNTLSTTTEHDYSGVQTVAAGSSFTYTGTITVLLQNIGDTLQAQFRTNAGTASKVLQGTAGTANTSTLGAVFFQMNVQEITAAALLQSARGDLGQWEFLKGIMTMFNLVAIPDKDNPNNIIFEPYADVFINETVSGTVTDLTLKSRGIAHDWTEKIDIADIKLEPLTNLNKKTIFKFVEDDEDYAFTNYKHSVQGHLYGSNINNEVDLTILDGEDEIIAEPFAATVPKAIMDQFPDFIVPAIYSYNPEDDTSSSFNNSPRIFYNNGVKTLASHTYYIPAQNGFSSENQDDFLQFTHLTEAPVTTSAAIDFHFGECQTLGLGSTPNNLYGMYWSPYYNELYNPDTRIMTIKVNLTPSDINTFNFYDTVFIKQRQYRVNKIDYKPHDLSTVEFILIP
jgi:hypothetical protein